MFLIAKNDAKLNCAFHNHFVSSHFVPVFTFVIDLYHVKIKTVLLTCFGYAGQLFNLETLQCLSTCY